MSLALKRGRIVRRKVDSQTDVTEVVSQKINSPLGMI